MTDSSTTTPPTPSTTSIALATALLAGITGYFIGQGSSLGLFRSSASAFPSTRKRARTPRRSWPNSYDVTIHPDASDDDDEEDGEVVVKGVRDGGGSGNSSSSSSSSDDDEEDKDEDEDEDEEMAAVKSFKGNNDEHKLVLVVRTDLGMQKGKIAAQASHGTLGNYCALASRPRLRLLLRRWEAGGQAKIAVQVRSEAELMALRAEARRVGLCARVVRDAGRTQVVGGSVTVLGVGPGPAGVVDGVTGGLKLL